MFNRSPIKIKLVFKSPHWVILIRNNSFGKQWDYVRVYEKIEAMDEWKEKILINPVKTFDTLREAEEHVNKFFVSRQPKTNIFKSFIRGIKSIFTKDKPNETNVDTNKEKSKQTSIHGGIPNIVKYDNP